jgi:hypothetical protein
MRMLMTVVVHPHVEAGSLVEHPESVVPCGGFASESSAVRSGRHDLVACLTGGVHTASNADQRSGIRSSRDLPTAETPAQGGIRPHLRSFATAHRPMMGILDRSAVP